MKTIHVRNVGGDKHDQIYSAYESIGASKQRLEVFLAICKGSKKEKSVTWIRENTTLKNNKRVTEETKKLADDEVIIQLEHKVDGETGYKKVDFLCKHKKAVLKLINDKHARENFATKINPKIKFTKKSIGIKLTLPKVGIKTQPISIQKIDEFSKIKNIKSMDYDLEKNEDDIKALFKKIAGEKGKFTDSPVEKNDLLTYLTMNGKKFLIAFAFKGKSKKRIKKLRPMDMGKNGDQVERLFSSPAEIFFVQFVGQMHELMLSKMEEQATLKSHYTGKKIYYGIIDGNDTSKIFSQYSE